MRTRVGWRVMHQIHFRARPGAATARKVSDDGASDEGAGNNPQDVISQATAVSKTAPRASFVCKDSTGTSVQPHLDMVQ